MSLSPAEGRLRGFIRALSSLKQHMDKLLVEDSHSSIYDAVQYSKATSRDTYSRVDSLLTAMDRSLYRVMSKIVFDAYENHHEALDLDDTLQDCYDAICISLDSLNGKAPVMLPDVKPNKRLKLEPFDSPNVACPDDRNTIFSRDSNPYEECIRNLSFSDSIFFEQYGPITVNEDSGSNIACRFIDSEPDLLDVMDELDKEKVIGVDLENHNYYSYHGFTCLLQISSLTMDFIIDAIKLRTPLRSCLPRIMSTPRILKILHGSEHDSSWLQRDFDCFLVSVFDTFIAAKKIGEHLPKKGLNSLLSHYFNGISLDKKYQLADWRLRPLPKEMLSYARFDTHYLIPLWNRMKKNIIELQGKDQLVQAYSASSLQCLKLYKPETHNPLHWKALASKSSIVLDQAQQKIMESVYQWVYEKAREHDVCLHAILPTRRILGLALTRPKTVSELKLSLREGYSRFVEVHAEELVGLIHGEEGSPIRKNPNRNKESSNVVHKLIG